MASHPTPFVRAHLFPRPSHACLCVDHHHTGGICAIHCTRTGHVAKWHEMVPAELHDRVEAFMNGGGELGGVTLDQIRGKLIAIGQFADARRVTDSSREQTSEEAQWLKGARWPWYVPVTHMLQFGDLQFHPILPPQQAGVHQTITPEAFVAALDSIESGRCTITRGSMAGFIGSATGSPLSQQEELQRLRAESATHAATVATLTAQLAAFGVVPTVEQSR